MLKDAIWLTKRQWSHTRLGFVFTIAFYAAYGGLAGMFTNDWFEDMQTFTAVMVDFVIFVFLSMNGFVFCKGYLNNPYWKTDAFTKHLAMLRSLPIPVESLAMSRSVQILLVSPISTIVFFLPLYLVSDWAQSLPLATYLQFVVVWFAFGNACSSWFVVEEWSQSGKRYLLHSCFAVLLLLVAVVAAAIFAKRHIAFGLAEALGRPGGWMWTVLALAIAAAAHLWMLRKLRRMLLTRDFA